MEKMSPTHSKNLRLSQEVKRSRVAFRITCQIIFLNLCLFDLWCCRGRPPFAHFPREPEDCWEAPVFGSRVSWVWSHQVQRPNWYVSVCACVCICLYFHSFQRGNASSAFHVLSFCFSPEEEFQSTYLNPLLSQWTLHQQMKPASPARDPAPASWDWRDHGAVSPVKNQVPTNRVN